MPSLSGAAAWLNSPPLTAEEPKGKVVLVDFWTYSCDGAGDELLLAHPACGYLHRTAAEPLVTASSSARITSFSPMYPPNWLQPIM